MSVTIPIAKFCNQKQRLHGTCAPMDLPRLADLLAGDAGEIRYELAGNTRVDASGSQTRRVKCIIYGWFLLTDPVTLKPERHELAIESNLVIVHEESDLPPLEAEADDEDYIVCGPELDVLERIEEEILLEMPASHAIGAVEGEGSAPEDDSGAGKKISPFAKLAGLKKKPS